MCTCASCEYTDGFKNSGFTYWPSDEPKGSRQSASEYSAHVAYSRQWGRDASGRISLGAAVPDSARTIAPEPRYPSWVTAQCVAPIAPAPKYVHDWINRKMPDRAEAPPARPDQPGKPEPHLPAQDRPRESATIYDMAKAKREQDAKRPRGRPAIGKPFLVRLEPEQIERARALGGGNISAGIREALRATSYATGP